VRAGWSVICELASRLGLDLGVGSPASASQALFDRVPFYEGLTLEEIGGRGVRWQERPAAARAPASGAIPQTAGPGPDGGPAEGEAAEMAGFRSLWDAPEVEASPALEFLAPVRELVA
jgi:NADH-quinone oxidoreductase subunit G